MYSCFAIKCIRFESGVQAKTLETNIGALVSLQNRGSVSPSRTVAAIVSLQGRGNEGTVPKQPNPKPSPTPKVIHHQQPTLQL